jgi:hypothetical protein
MNSQLNRAFFRVYLKFEYRFQFDEDYTQQQFRLGQPIISPLLKSLQLRLDDILPR